MRSRTDEERVWPTFPVGPILVHYGGEEPIEGGRYKYRCPFHDDRYASATVDTTENWFKCHGCDMKGGSVHLIMKHERLPYADAVKRAEEITRTRADELYGASRSGSSVSRRARNRQGTRSLGRARGRGRSDPGA